jgi:predicted lipoprotein with Yx(FWY)xxD motif
MKWAAYALCLLAALAIGLAGCGSGDSTDPGEQPVANTEPSSAAIAVVSAAEVGGLGTILVDAEGRALYDFHKDRRTNYLGISSACYGVCAEGWPPLLTGGEPEAEGTAISTKVGMLKRKDGTLQVTYYGHPLYTYEGDKGPGEASGNGVKAFGGEWHALQPNNEEPRG